MNIILKFVTSYIRDHMSHENTEVRNEIFKAINDGMMEEFREDNCPTRIYSTVRWLAENDSELRELSTNPISVLNAAECAREAIREVNFLN